MSDEGVVDGGGGGGVAPAPYTGNVTAPASAPQAAEFKVPSEWADKSWAAKVKSQDDLYKQIDSLTGLVGKKTVHPLAENASDEERAEYYSKLAPADASEYDFGEGGDAKFNAEVGKIFKEYGIDKHQAKGLVTKVNEISLKMHEAQQAEAKNPEAFAGKLKEAYGDKYLDVVKSVEATINKHGAEGDFELINGLTNDLRMALTRTIHRVTQAYGAKEGDSAAGSGSSPAGDVTKVRADLRKKLMDLKKNPMHTAQQKQALIDQLQSTYKQR